MCVCMHVGVHVTACVHRGQRPSLAILELVAQVVVNFCGAWESDIYLLKQYYAFLATESSLQPWEKMLKFI